MHSGIRYLRYHLFGIRFFFVITLFNSNASVRPKVAKFVRISISYETNCTSLIVEFPPSYSWRSCEVNEICMAHGFSFFFFGLWRTPIFLTIDTYLPVLVTRVHILIQKVFFMSLEVGLSATLSILFANIWHVNGIFWSLEFGLYCC